MKWVLEVLLFFAVALLGLKLMGSVVTYRDAEIWFKPSPQSEVLHLKGDASYPLSGGIQVRAPEGRAVTYPNAALISMASERQPYAWSEKLEFAGIFLGVLAVWLLIAWPDIRRFRDLLNRKRL
jgi:hypothetical protein